jgi:hypothetical protein
MDGAEGLYLVYLAFGLRHPPKDSARWSVYEFAYSRLHGRCPAAGAEHGVPPAAYGGHLEDYGTAYSWDHELAVSGGCTTPLGAPVGASTPRAHPRLPHLGHTYQDGVPDEHPSATDEKVGTGARHPSVTTVGACKVPSPGEQGCPSDGAPIRRRGYPALRGLPS